MKAILSIKPEYVYRILSGGKEIRVPQTNIQTRRRGHDSDLFD